MQWEKFRDEKGYQELVNPTAGGWETLQRGSPCACPVLVLSSGHPHVLWPCVCSQTATRAGTSTGDGRGDGLPRVQAAISGSSEPPGRMEGRRGAPAPMTAQWEEMSCEFNHSLGREG